MKAMSNDKIERKTSFARYLTCDDVGGRLRQWPSVDEDHADQFAHRDTYVFGNLFN